MDKAYPILVIITNKECGHCVNMRGKHGWPSDKLPTFHSGSSDRWNIDFFNGCLTGGIYDGVQKARVIELHFSKLIPDPPLEEVTFFDLNPITGDIVIKKYQHERGEGLTLSTMNKNGFIDSKIIPNMNFNQFVDMYIPLTGIKRYLYVFPAFIYVHSTIWENAALESENSLYARVQGFRTVRDGSNPRIYKILRKRRPDVKEYYRSPIDVIRKLIAFKLDPLCFPPDHID